MVYVNHVSQLEEHSTWRKFQAGVRELELLEAPKKTIKEFKYRAAQTCFLAFASLMMDENLKVADFHEIIACNLEAVANKETQRLIISCPPRSGKSLFSQLFCAWLLGRDQRTQHIVASYGQQLSNKFHRGICGYLRHPVFGRVFPEWKGFAPDSKYDIQGGGFILATSVGGVLTGFTAGSPDDRPDTGVGAIIVDDPLKNSNSKAALDGLDTWWSEEASTRRTNHWAQILIGTRFHERDLHGLLMEQNGLWSEDNPDGWRWINIQGLCEDPETDPLMRQINESHWPENSVFTVDMLLSQKRAMGSSAFSALYQGNPVASEGSIIKAGWVSKILPDEAPEFDFTYLALDTAFSEKESADESVIAVMGYSKEKPDNIYVREIISGRWAFPDLIAWVKNTIGEYRPRMVCIEAAASGQSLIQVLEREIKLPIEKFKPLRSKSVRLQTVAPLFEAGRVQVIDPDDNHWVHPFVKQLCAFPYDVHDDQVDACVWGLHYYQTHLDGGAREANAALSIKARHMPGRSGLFGDFSELTSNNNKVGRGSLFGRGGSGDAYRLGQGGGSSIQRSKDLKFDTNL